MIVLAQIVDASPLESPVMQPEPGFDLWQLLFTWGRWPYLAFLIWMAVWCLRHDPERFVWLWIILIFQPVGAFIYFLARWLPDANFARAGILQRLTRGSQINRLQIAARQIGNAHQYIELGDALRESGQWSRSLEAYLKALERDSQNPQALWGAACGQFHSRQFEAAYENLSKLLAIDPAYKFGDVSLLYGKTLHALQQTDRAQAHLETHIRRWRHPEALHLLACLYADNGHPERAREHLQALIMDIEASPSAIARKQSIWRSRAKKLLKRLPSRA